MIFKYNGSGIPVEIRPFFKVENLLIGQNQRVTLVYNSTEFNAKITNTNNRTRILWHTDFKNAISKFKNRNDTVSPTLMTFEKMPNNKYQISFENSITRSLTSDLQLEKITNTCKVQKKEKTKTNSVVNVDYVKKTEADSKTGYIGETYVLDYEKKELLKYDKQELADKVEHISVIKGDGTGYDIASFTNDGAIKYIEVKTSIGNRQDNFYMSLNEWEFAKNHQENYYLYRVYNLTKVPEIVIFSFKDLEQELEKTAVQFIFNYKSHS